MIILAIAGMLMAGQATEVSPMNPASWFDQDAYPADAIRRGEHGRVAFSVAVDAAGRPATCDVTTSSGSSSLDDATCAIIMAKGRFTPAHDSHGKPVAGTWSSATVWAIPDSGQPPIDLSAGRWQRVMSTVRVTIDKDGRALNCEPTPDAPPAGRNFCSGFPSGRFISGPLIKDGKPVTGVATFSLTETIEPAPDGS